MEKKKPSFKAPAFSVPSKEGADKTTASSSKCLKESIKSKQSNESKDENKEKREKKAFGSKVQNKGKKSKLKTEGLTAAGDSATVKQLDSSGDGTINKEIDEDKENICNTNEIPDCTGDQIKDQSETKDEKKENEEKLKEDKNATPKENVKSNLGKRKQDACHEGKKEKNIEKKISLPTRALTDEEYEEIFTAAIENALNMDIDSWTPKCTKEKKYKKRVGKPTASQEEKKGIDKNICKESVKKDKPNKDKMLKEKNESHADQGEIDDQCVKRGETNENQENIEIAANIEDVITNQILERVEVQVENETTPVGSGDELTSTVAPLSPPHKKMKPNKPPKKTKLVPKHLPFEKKVSEKKKREKKMTVRKDKHSSDRKSEKKKMTCPNAVKVTGKMSDRRKEMISRNISVQGTWVQCCRMDCKKWRYLPSVSEPCKLPEYWTCGMNTREDYNSCDKPEESYDETDHIYTKYCEGSIVLAKMAGYPWWPAMIEVDPDFDVFCWIDKNNTMLPTHYHVVFLDEKVSRVWVKASKILPFNGDEEMMSPDTSKSKKRGPSYGKELSIAKRNALNALDYPIQDRIQLFGFATKFKGQWSTENLKVDTATIQKGKTKQLKRKRELLKDEDIDESTMDDVLDNTEALLSNVEEMLDSLDSQIYDSNEDSDFSVSELVVEEKKRETKKQRGNVKKTLVQIYSDSSDQEIEVEEKGEQNEELDEGTELAKIEPIDNSVVVKGTTVSFDKDIFTMELDHEENDNIVEIVDDLNNSGLGIGLKEDMMQEMNDEIKDIVNKGINEDKMEDSLRKINKVELESKDILGKNRPEGNKTIKSKQGAKNTNENKSTKKSKAFKKQATTKTKKENEKIVKKSENEEEFKEDLNDPAIGEIKSSGKEKKGGVTVETEEAHVTVSENIEERPCKKEIETGEKQEDNININRNKEDRTCQKNSPLLSTNDALVPEVQENLNTDTELSLNEGISLDDDTEVGFDFGDHSMYEVDTGADKIAERAMFLESSNVPLGTVDVQEDSDPFDMIEE